MKRRLNLICLIALVALLAGCNDGGNDSLSLALLNEPVYENNNNSNQPVVPEPTTLALFALGSGGLYLCRKKRK